MALLRILCMSQLPLLSLFDAVPLARAEPSPPQDTRTLESLQPQELAQFLSIELTAEERRPQEKLYSFNEFEWVAEMDCNSRLFYLMNETVNMRDGMRAYHSDILGVSGVFIQFLRKMPQENSWIWLLATSQERAAQKIQTYWTKIMAMALDQHHCVPQLARDVLLDGVIKWKNLYGQLSELFWYGFAFGVYTEAAALQNLNHQGVISDSAFSNRSVDEHFMTGNMWIADVRNWCEDFSQKLYKAMLKYESEESKEAAKGPVRLHHQDEHGSFVDYEFLRRKVFKQWAIDKGLVRGLLRYVWKPGFGDAEPISLADFGAGGGHYSAWMNETGLVKAHAFDGTAQAEELSGGAVQQVNLGADMTLWRTFDWVLCLEVGEHVPKQYSKTLLSNLKKHATQGLVMSWSDDWEGIGHVNCLSRDEFISFVQSETGFVLDHEATEKVRAACEIDYIARTLAIFRAPSSR
eukprot:TRINITY_DN23148_c1_g1_i1.p1 TRINITY_DN23148_c1_g1~~TRINITY_DN23148_c1_g1_i1.p1  ORF type:complete len:506 (-),score=80.08 TRINITY_DN23148_c1_g1_i1:196-1587(-)